MRLEKIHYLRSNPRFKRYKQRKDRIFEVWNKVAEN